MKVASIPLTPIWREGLLGMELAGLLRNDVFRDPPHVPGSLPVLLIPGFLTGDAQMGTLASWLRRCGHRTHTSGIRLNVDCAEAAMGRLEERAEAYAEQEGEAIVLLGQSRGGTFARALAVRRPDLVRMVVTLGSPHLSPLAVNPLVWIQGAALAALSAIGVKGIASHRCRSGACCERFWDDLAAPMPRSVKFVSIYSRQDGIVDWEACVDAHAINLEVRSTHCGMGLNAAVYELLHRELRPPPAGRKPKRALAGARAAA